MARFYGNENFDHQVAEYLRAKGHDVLTAQQAGKANQRIPDDEVLEFAISEKRAILTFNRKDFFRLHRNYPNHEGIVACTYDSNYEALAERIHLATIENGEILAEILVRIYKPN